MDIKINRCAVILMTGTLAAANCFSKDEKTKKNDRPNPILEQGTANSFLYLELAIEKENDAEKVRNLAKGFITDSFLYFTESRINNNIKSRLIDSAILSVYRSLLRNELCRDYVLSIIKNPLRIDNIDNTTTSFTLNPERSLTYTKNNYEEIVEKFNKFLCDE